MAGTVTSDVIENHQSNQSSSTDVIAFATECEAEIQPLVVAVEEASSFFIAGIVDIHKVVEDGDLEKLQELYHTGDLLTEMNDNHENLLHIASRNLWYDIMHFLVCKDLDPNAKSSGGQTPLHCAVLSPFLKVRGLACVTLLLAFGANPSIVDKENRKPRDYLSDALLCSNSQHLVDIFSLLVTAELRACLELRRSEDQASSDSLQALKCDVHDSKILIQDLKSSVITLKVAMSRLEDDAKDLSGVTISLSKDKQRLESQLVDLEFRFNELITKDEGESYHGDAKEHGITSSLKADSDRLLSKLQLLEDHVQEVHFKVAKHEAYNKRLDDIASDLSHQAKVVHELNGTLKAHEIELAKVSKLQKFPDISCAIVPAAAPGAFDAALADGLQGQLNRCIRRTQEIERSVEAAWVGLVAAMLLIPLAFFWGKFI